jgi:hypothetical protein
VYLGGDVHVHGTDDDERLMHEVESGEHALLVGLVHGYLLRLGVNVEPEYDDAGNYLASLVIVLPEPARGTRVRIVVEQMEQEQ